MVENCDRMQTRYARIGLLEWETGIGNAVWQEKHLQMFLQFEYLNKRGKERETEADRERERKSD